MTLGFCWLLVLYFMHVILMKLYKILWTKEWSRLIFQLKNFLFLARYFAKQNIFLWIRWKRVRYDMHCFKYHYYIRYIDRYSGLGPYWLWYSYFQNVYYFLKFNDDILVIFFFFKSNSISTNSDMYACS